MGSNISVSGLVKVEYSIQPLESSRISTLNVIAVYKAVLSSNSVGGAPSSATTKKWLTIDEAQKFTTDNMLLKPQFILQCLNAIKQGGGIAEEEGGAMLQYVEREMSWEEKVLKQAGYGPNGMLCEYTINTDLVIIILYTILAKLLKAKLSVLFK